MVKRVAVEQTLSGISDLLHDSGYEVIDLDPISTNSEIATCKAVVISGQDSNVTGIEDVATKAAVISAQGKTPQEVLAQVQSRIGK